MARGWLTPAVKFHDFLNAMASAKACKQPGIDGVVAEMTRALSWPTFVDSNTSHVTFSPAQRTCFMMCDTPHWLKCLH